jgi:hypothetical protein
MAVSSDSLRLAVAAEVTPGVPVAGTYDLFRTTGEGLVFEVSTTTSNEMGGLNRGVKDNILTGAQVTGEINFELSKFKAFEDLMAAALGNKWDADPLTVPGIGTDDVYDAAIYQTFTIEKRFTLSTDPNVYSYNLFTGCMVDTMSLSITPNEPITGSFGFVGEAATVPADENGTTYNGAGTSPVMTAPLVTGIELLSPAGIDNVTGLPIGSPVPWSTTSCFTGLDLNFNNNGRGIQCIGTLGNAETVLGRFEVAATGSLYYAGNDPLDALIGQEEFALRVTCADDDGETFQFLLPRVSFSEASALASGTNTDVITEFSIQALEFQGDTYAITAIITRSQPATASVVTGVTAAQLGSDDE